MALSRLATAFRGAGAVAYGASSAEDWSATLAARHVPPYVVGFAYIGVHRIWLSPPICAGVPAADPWAVLVFLHELEHAGGVRSESRANCLALEGEKRFLERSLGLPADRAESVYEQSWARVLAEPPSYQPRSC